MDLTLTSPALLFPAISLLLLAYTNRFVTLANLIRSLHASHQKTPDERILRQIRNLRHRVFLIKNMQALGVGSIFLCVLCMLVLFLGLPAWGKGIFVLSLLCMLGSLALSLWEIQVSVEALKVQLEDLEGIKQSKESPD